MKSTNLLLAAIFVPALFSLAQDNKTAVSIPPTASAPAESATHATPAPTTTATGMQAISDTYVIGPTDVLTVTVWKEQTLSGGYMVRPDGMISVPLLGDVQASGLTTLQLADQISGKLKKFMQDPTVTVILTSINSKKIYMLGEFGRKGPIEMTPGMTLLQAIGTAGGMDEYANAKKMYILRTEGGVQKKIFVHYKQALKGDMSQNVFLKAGDTIVVP